MGIAKRASLLFCATAVCAAVACGGGGGGGGQAPPPPPAAQATLVLINNSGLSITQLYVSPSASSTWGPNQLSSPVPSGSSRVITNIPAGSYDLRAVASDGSYAERFGVALAAGGGLTWTLSPPASNPASLRVVNQYTSPIARLFVTPSGSSTWGSNQLSASIPVSGTFTLTNIPPGAYDFRAEASNGAYWERYAQALNSGSQFTWTLIP